MNRSKNFWWNKAFQSLKIRFLHYRQIYRYNRSPHRKKQPLLIYQMGKVGSSTIRKSINALNLDLYAYHLHYMSGIGYMMKLCRNKGVPLQDHILASIYCKKLLKKAKTENRKIYIVSMVRDPIAKNISQFFQNVEISYPEFKYEDKVKKLNQEELVSEMIDFFIDNFIHDDPLVWFDVELKRFAGIDVFKENFPHEKGFNIYENKNFRVMVIRLENLNETVEEAMSSFLGVEKFNLVNENISKEKNYSKLYEKVKRDIKLPNEYIKKMYESKMAKHFYTPIEIKIFRKHWKRAN